MIATKRTQPRRTTKPTPRIKPGRLEDPAHLQAIRSLPCLACEIQGEEQVYRTEAHHLRRKADGTTYGKGQKAADRETIPLCMNHHWNGAYCQSRGWTLVEFEALFGSERELLAMTLARLEDLP